MKSSTVNPPGTATCKGFGLITARCPAVLIAARRSPVPYAESANHDRTRSRSSASPIVCSCMAGASVGSVVGVGPAGTGWFASASTVSVSVDSVSVDSASTASVSVDSVSVVAGASGARAAWMSLARKASAIAASELSGPAAWVSSSSVISPVLGSATRCAR